ncbi:MAG: invasion associated locus B family protein, partial [Pseudomonadota bacterium]|nr:invasion associated locus B family protein [Pseudomonadota bacterium]
GTDVTLSVGGQNFDLFTHQSTIDTAWSYGYDEDNIIKEMKKGTQMIVKGVSTRGTDTKDTYSLYGFTAAYKSALKACKD